jgi:hypothetical protein
MSTSCIVTRALNPNCDNAGTTAGFVMNPAVSSPETSEGKATLWRIFSLDSQTLNKISISSAFCLPTSKAHGN